VGLHESRFIRPLPADCLDRQGQWGRGLSGLHTRKQRDVALKRLHPQFAADERFRARFFKHCSRAARLTEAHIIPIHDFGEIDGNLFVDMRLIKGGNLADALAAAGHFSPEHAGEVVRQVAGALDATHAAGIVHRNVKRSNVLVGTDEPSLHCYLADFGVDAELASPTATGGLIGRYDHIRAGAVARQARRPPRGCVRAGVPALRAPDWHATVSTRRNGGEDPRGPELRAPTRIRARCRHPADARYGHRPRHGERSSRPLLERRRAGGGRSLCGLRESRRLACRGP
jgi:serine/threonine protein kinase